MASGKKRAVRSLRDNNLFLKLRNPPPRADATSAGAYANSAKTLCLYFGILCLIPISLQKLKNFDFQRYLGR